MFHISMNSYQKSIGDITHSVIEFQFIICYAIKYNLRLIIRSIKGLTFVSIVYKYLIYNLVDKRNESNE